MRKQHKKQRKKSRFFVKSLVVILIAFAVFSYFRYSNTNILIRNFAKENNLSISEWPDELIELLDKNPETKDFVLNYPLKKNVTMEVDLSEYKDCDSVPLFMQWDERWGYNEYAGELMGISGCGPTCLSMVSVYLLNNADYTPQYIAEFAETNGYSVSGNGSSWTLISNGGEELGLDITEIPLVEKRIIDNWK